MPRIIDYPQVLHTLTSQGLRSLYHNSGAFGFVDAGSVRHRGWIGPEDPSLRPEAIVMAHRIAPPHASNLAQLALQGWQTALPGRVWVMPRSHWAYELDFGSSAWMPYLIEQLGLDAGFLKTRTTADAIEFDTDEGAQFEKLIEKLLDTLAGSDFSLAFPGRPAVCTVHHHKQLWWSTSDTQVLAGLDSVAERSGLIGG